MNRHQGGYIGLVVLLVAVAVLGIVFANMYLMENPIPVVDKRGAIGTTTTQTGIERAHADVDAARAVQEKMNDYNAEIRATLGN